MGSTQHSGEDVMTRRTKVVVAWSGGKDSLLALWKLPPEYEVVALLTNLNGERVSIHGVRRRLIEAQADALGLPVQFIMLTAQPSNNEYERLTAEACAPFQEQGVRHVVYGDLFLEDIRQYRDSFLRRLGMEGIYPLWGVNTSNLIRDFIDAGFKALLTCVDTIQLDAQFIGRDIDAALLDDLPPSADPCGENGEFHTFAYDGPLFRHGLSLTLGERWSQDGRFCYVDMLEE
jgi:uncharacterized protein (TIGR00290 family)